MSTVDKWTQKSYKAVDGINYSYAEYTPRKMARRTLYHLVTWCW